MKASPRRFASPLCHIRNTHGHISQSASAVDAVAWNKTPTPKPGGSHDLAPGTSQTPVGPEADPVSLCFQQQGSGLAGSAHQATFPCSRPSRCLREAPDSLCKAHTMSPPPRTFPTGKIPHISEPFYEIVSAFSSIIPRILGSYSGPTALSLLFCIMETKNSHFTHCED